MAQVSLKGDRKQVDRTASESTGPISDAGNLLGRPLDGARESHSQSAFSQFRPGLTRAEWVKLGGMVLPRPFDDRVRVDVPVGPRGRSLPRPTLHCDRQPGGQVSRGVQARAASQSYDLAMFVVTLTYHVDL